MLIALGTTNIHHPNRPIGRQGWWLAERRSGTREPSSAHNNRALHRRGPRRTAQARTYAVITLRRFRRLEAILRDQGYAETIAWSESVQPPQSPEEFAREAIYVICNSGMAVTIGAPIAARCIARLEEGGSAEEVFGHPGKRVTIDSIWLNRAEHFAEFQATNAKLEFLESLPWIGPVTRYHLAKNLGADEAKPDVHMERLARRDKTSTRTLCRITAYCGVIPKTAGCCSTLPAANGCCGRDETVFQSPSLPYLGSHKKPESTWVESSRSLTWHSSPK